MSTETTPIPPLRPDVGVVDRGDTPGFPAVLMDGTLEQRVRLDRLGAAVARALDRPQTLAELVARLDPALPAEERTPERVAETVAGLERLFALTDERAVRAVEERRLAERWMTAPVEEVPLLYVADARFDCTGCGGCCGGHNVGPVDDHVRERLATPAGHELLASHGLPDPPYWSGAQVSGGGGRDVSLLRSVGGWCVFLDECNRCRLHATFGGPSKPSVCQLFPFSFVLRPDGVAVSFQMECRDILNGVRTGRPLREQEDEIRRLLRLPQEIQRVRPAVPIDGMATLSYAAYATLRDELLASVATPPVHDPLAALGRLRALVEERGRPQAEGPGAQVRRLAPGELRDALHETIQDLGGQLVALRRSLVDEDGERVVRTTSLDRVLGGLSRLVPALERVVAVPRDPDACELFRLLAVNALMGEEVGSARSLRHGLTTLALRWIVARAIAVDRAHDVKRPEPTAQEHIDGLVTASFAFRSPRTRAILQKLAGPLSLVFYDHLDEVRLRAAELAAPDRRIEVYLS